MSSCDYEQSEGTLFYMSYLWRSATHNLVTSFKLVKLVLVDLTVTFSLQHQLDQFKFLFLNFKFMLNHIKGFDMII